MKIWNRPKPLYLSEQHVSPAAFYEFNVGSLTKKADKYKWWSRCSTILLITSSALIPLFIGVFDHWVLAKLVPSGLAALSVMMASFIQLEKPQERWKLYRRAQRRLEEEWLYYKNGVEKYENLAEDVDKMFLTSVQNILLNLHKSWEGLVPESSEAASYAARKADTINR